MTVYARGKAHMGASAHVVNLLNYAKCAFTFFARQGKRERFTPPPWNSITRDSKKTAALRAAALKMTGNDKTMTDK